MEGDPIYVPRFGSRTLVYLHLFSGHRRKGDIQQSGRTAGARWGNCCCPVSRRHLYDSKAGDLADVANQKVWLDFAKRGCIAGAFAGPPCETWSRARSLGGVPGFSFGDAEPRLLRTSAQPEGLGNMKAEELQQLILANRLLAFTVMLFAVLAMEHPACPSGQGDEWLPSIWKLYILRALVAMDGVRLLEIQQGLFDGISPKPTFHAFRPLTHCRKVSRWAMTRAAKNFRRQLSRAIRHRCARLWHHLLGAGHGVLYRVLLI